MTNVEATNEISDSVSPEERKTRYSGPVTLTEMKDEEVDFSTSGMGRGRPSIDLTPYEDVLKKNYAANSSRPTEKKLAKKYTVETAAVGTVKSRFNSAASNINVGLTWQIVDNEDGTSTIFVVAGKRLEGRGRKPGHATDKPENSSAKATGKKEVTK